MIDVEHSEPKRPDSAYATLAILTAKDRCVALALATTNLTSSALIVAASIWANFIRSPHGYSAMAWFYGDIKKELCPINFLTTVLCILASYCCRGRGWRILFALCSLLGTLCFCLMACQGQLYRE